MIALPLAALSPTTVKSDEQPLHRLMASRGIRAFRPAPEGATEAFETRHGVRFSPPFRSFLRITDGLTLEGLRSDVPLIREIRAIGGIQNRAPHADLEAEFRREDGFYRRDFLPFAVIVAKAREGSPVCEVSAGARAGEIMFADHEVYHDMADGFRVADRSPDEVIGEFVGSGWFNPIARSFDDLLQKLTSGL